MSSRAVERKALPEGTLTLLFADVEGSTRLLIALGGDRFGVVRSRARELVRLEAARYHGHEVDWAGDGVFLAFERPRDAVAAAAALQRALAAEPWDPDEAIRLRIGIHTGEPRLDNEGYVGLDVVIAARICAAAHGGQVVVSETTQELVGAASLADVSFRPLGNHRLKDIPNPAPLFQLDGPGLAEDFPPLSTLGGSVLPALHHRLVGRAAQVEQIKTLLARPDVRLVTVTGPGGTGKSRLALEVATRIAEQRPVHLVGLASLSNPALVPNAIAQELGVRESPGRSLLADVSRALAGKHTLLYLDNMEHLAPAAEYVRELLDAAPDLDILTTSRSPLRLSSEVVLPLDPLPVDEATEFFVDLARTKGASVPDELAPTVGEICRRLDCLPLAIELVAAHTRFLSPGELLEAIDGGLALRLRGPVDLPERQRTLHATIDWSYALLTPSQRELHGALAVFAGGCALEDARVVAGSPPDFLADLEALVLGSLVRGTAAGQDVRLTMLETVREDATARLRIDGRLEEYRVRHAERFAAVAEEAEGGLEGAEQAVWLERLERELDNVRSALEFAFATRRTELGLRTAAGLSRFWRAHGHVTEARRWFSEGLAQADDVPADVRARALWAAARQAMAQSAAEDAQSLVEQALPLFRTLGWEREVVFALSELALILLDRDVERAQAIANDAVMLARKLSDPRAVSGALSILAASASMSGDYGQAVSLQEEALDLRRALGDRLLVADSAYNLGEAAFFQGDAVRARTALEEALALAAELGETPHFAAATCLLGELALRDGDLVRAGELLRESLAIYVELEDDRTCAECLCGLAGVAAAEGAAEHAARLWGAADELRHDAPVRPHELEIVARFGPALAADLGEARLSELRAEGAGLSLETATSSAALAQP